MNTINKNGRIYSKSAMERAVYEYKQKTKRILREKKLKRIIDGNTNNGSHNTKSQIFS